MFGALEGRGVRVCTQKRDGVVPKVVSVRSGPMDSKKKLTECANVKSLLSSHREHLLACVTSFYTFASMIHCVRRLHARERQLTSEISETLYGEVEHKGHRQSLESVIARLKSEVRKLKQDLELIRLTNDSNTQRNTKFIEQQKKTESAEGRRQSNSPRHGRLMSCVFVWCNVLLPDNGGSYHAALKSERETCHRSVSSWKCLW